MRLLKEKSDNSILHSHDLLFHRRSTTLKRLVLQSNFNTFLGCHKQAILEINNNTYFSLCAHAVNLQVTNENQTMLSSNIKIICTLKQIILIYWQAH
jgi:hypothetical protein